MVELDEVALDAAYRAFLDEEYEDKTNLTFHDEDCIRAAIRAYLETRAAIS